MNHGIAIMLSWRSYGGLKTDVQLESKAERLPKKVKGGARVEVRLTQ